MATYTLGSGRAAITAENTGLVAVAFPPGTDFNISIAGVNGHTLTLQRAHDSRTLDDEDVVWNDVEEFTADAEVIGESPASDTLWRLFCKTGAFGTGTVEAQLRGVVR